MKLSNVFRLAAVLAVTAALAPAVMAAQGDFASALVHVVLGMDPSVAGILMLANAPVALDMKTVIEEMGKVTTELRGYVDRKVEEAAKTGNVDPVTTAAIEKSNNAITELRGQYEQLLKASQRPAPAGKDGEQITPEMELRQKSFVKFLRYGFGETGRASFTPDEVRALSSASDSEGGFVVPPAWEGGILMKAFDGAELRPICNVGTTSRDKVMVPSLKKPVVSWGVTNVAVDPQTMGAGSESIQILDLKGLALIHNNTLDDADADIWAELSAAFGMAIAEAEDDAYAAGNGATEPQGVMKHATVLTQLVKTGVAAALYDATHNGIDPLITALHNLKKPYRRNATWAMNSITEGLVRTLKDANGQYLWQPPVQAGSPATLLGRPVVNPEGMADVAANAFPIVVGDFRTGYRIRDRAGITVQRLVEKYAEYDQTGFLIKKRTGGKVVMAEAFQVIKVSA